MRRSYELSGDPEKDEAQSASFSKAACGRANLRAAGWATLCGDYVAEWMQACVPALSFPTFVPTAFLIGTGQKDMRCDAESKMAQLRTQLHSLNQRDPRSDCVTLVPTRERSVAAARVAAIGTDVDPVMLEVFNNLYMFLQFPKVEATGNFCLCIVHRFNHGNSRNTSEACIYFLNHRQFF